MPDAALAAHYPAYGKAHVRWIRRLRRIHQWRGADAGCGACRALSGLQESTRRVDKAFTPHPPVRGADAGCGACCVLSGLRNVHVGWIRRLRRIHQWRGADAGCDACRALSGLQESTCRVDKAFTPHPPVKQCRCRMRRLSRLIRPTECTRRVDKAFTPNPPVKRCRCRMRRLPRRIRHG